MNLVSVNKDPSARDLAWFELFAYVLLLGAGTLSYWRQNFLVAGVAAGVPLLLFVLFRALPKSRRVVYLGWCYLTLPIGLLVSHSLFLSLYFLVLTPIGLLKRLFGRSWITRRFDPEAKSYWTTVEKNEDVGRYFRQF